MDIQKIIDQYQSIIDVIDQKLSIANEPEFLKLKKDVLDSIRKAHELKLSLKQ